MGESNISGGDVFPSPEDWQELWEEFDKDQGPVEVLPPTTDPPYVPDYDALLDDSAAGYSY